MRHRDIPVKATVCLPQKDFDKLLKYGWWVSEQGSALEYGSDDYNPQGIYRRVVLPLSGFAGPRYFVSRVGNEYLVQGRTLVVVGYPEEIGRRLLDIRRKLGNNLNVRFIQR